MSDEMTLTDVSAEQAIALLESWLDSDDSNIRVKTESEILEAKNNKAIYPIALKGFAKSFAQLSRVYNADKDETTIRLSTFAYDEATKRVKTGKRTLAMKSAGDNVFHAGDSSVVKIANWRLSNSAMSPLELSLMLANIRKANHDAFPQWGNNAALDYVNANKSAKVVQTYTA